MALDETAFALQLAISPDMLERFRKYHRLLERWQTAINLVSGRTLHDIWGRHFLDSAQLVRAVPDDARSLLDIGSGAGFPGMVLALLGAGDVHLVEADGRKCQFLREVARETGTAVTIHDCRVEHLPVRPFDVVTARACAPLAQLVGLARPFLRSHSTCLFSKGRRAEEEVTAARRRWTMRCTLLPSITDRSGKLVRLEGVPDETTTTRR